MTKGKSRLAKGLSVFMATALMFTMLPGGMLKASAATTLSITQTGGTGGYTQDASTGNITISQNGNYTITGDGSPTTDTVTVTGCTANVTIDNVNIKPASGCSFELDNGASVNLTLTRANTLDTSGSSGDCAGLSVNTGNTLAISGTGSLAAKGGHHGAGIGGNDLQRCGFIRISGGTVTATSGYDSAGIGGGHDGDGGTITITGGSVTAIGGNCAENTDFGAGIGGGGSEEGMANCNGGTINITGGAITATGGDGSAGIGGGNVGNGGTVNISGGAITATGNSGGAGIGGGTGGNGGTVNISGGAITATGNSGGAGIGGGLDGSEGAVTIIGGTVVAKSTPCIVTGSGIGGGNSGYAGTTVITGGSVYASSVQGRVSDGNGHWENCVSTTGIAANTPVTGSVNCGPTSDMQTDENDKLYLWMPATGVATVKSGGTWYSTGILSVSGNTTASLSSMQSLDIATGSITIANGSITQANNSSSPFPTNDVVITGSSTENTVSVTGGTHNIVLSGVTIDVSNDDSACAFSTANTSSVNLSLSGANTLKSGRNRAGLEAPQGASLSITGGASDSLLASSYIFGAGIGGGGSHSGNGGTGGTITINGGKVDAYGSAGIGGGYGGDGGAGGTITINGGTVTAKCSSNLGAAIGGSGGSNTGGAGGIIIINGGTVNAISGNNDGIGIGGGSGNDSIGSGGAGGTVTITGGTVNTTRPDSGFGGIGGGDKGRAGRTTITGGSVKASSIQGTPTNGSVNLYPATVSVPSGKNVNALTIKQDYTGYNYGYRDMQTDITSCGKLYLWLPADVGMQETTTDIITDGGIYTGYHDKGSVNSSATVSNPGVLKMDQSVLSVSNINSSYAYGDTISPSVSGGSSTGTVTYSYSGAGTTSYAPSNTPPASPGSYTIAASKAEDSSYNAISSAPVNFSIVAKSLSSGFTVTLNSNSFIYTGSAIQPTVTVKGSGGNILDSSNYTVFYSNNTDAAAASDANPPTVTVTGRGNCVGDIYEHFTINKAAVTVKTLPTAGNFHVLGKLSSSTLTGGAATVPGTFSWSNPDAVVTQSGSYEVTFTPSDSVDYSPCTCMVTVTVAPVLTDSQSNIILDLTGVTLPAGVTSVSLGSTAQSSGSSAYSVVVKLIGKNSTLGNLSGLTVYDLKLLDQNGNPITGFTGKIKVKVPIPAGMSGNLKVLWYNPADGTLTDMKATQENGYLVFETSHFSYYAIAQMASGSPVPSSPVQNPKTGSGNWPFIPCAILGGAATGVVIIKRRRFFRIKKKA